MFWFLEGVILIVFYDIFREGWLIGWKLEVVWMFVKGEVGKSSGVFFIEDYFVNLGVDRFLKCRRVGKGRGDL